MNRAKSFIYFGKAVSVSQHRPLMGLSDMKEGKLPFYYLGVPLFVVKPSMDHLRPIVDKILFQLDA